MQRPQITPEAVVRHAHARTDAGGDTVSYPEHEHAGGGDFHEHLELFDYRGPCWLHVAPACGLLAAYWCNVEKGARCTPCAHTEAEEWPEITRWNAIPEWRQQRTVGLAALDREIRTRLERAPRRAR